MVSHSVTKRLARAARQELVWCVRQEGDAIARPTDDARRTSTIRLGAQDWSGVVAQGLVERTSQPRQWRLSDAGEAMLCRERATTDDRWRQQHHACPEATQATATPRQILGECPMDWLWARGGAEGFLSKAEYVAGCRFRQDRERAEGGSFGGVDWQRPPRDRHTGAPVNGRLPALAGEVVRQRLVRVREVLGPDLYAVLVAGACERGRLQALEARFGWPARAGKVPLKLALSRLASIYAEA